MIYVRIQARIFVLFNKNAPQSTLLFCSCSLASQECFSVTLTIALFCVSRRISVLLGIVQDLQPGKPSYDALLSAEKAAGASGSGQALVKLRRSAHGGPYDLGQVTYELKFPRL